MQTRREGADFYRWDEKSSAGADVPVGACWDLRGQPENDVGYRRPHTILDAP